MTDVHTPAQRSLNMSRIRGQDTKPEMLVRRSLHAREMRYRLHDKKLPGRPDLVFPQYKVVTFVHGCFWHAHNCPLLKLPATRQDFWKNKLEKNAERDHNAIKALHLAGWRVLIIWECALRGRTKLIEDDVINIASSEIRSGSRALLEISGKMIVPDSGGLPGKSH